MLKDDGVEPQVRRVVAERLGVAGDALAPEVSFADDLAHDRASIRDLVLAVESRLGVRVESRVLDEVRSYGDLVGATIEAIRAQRARAADAREGAIGGRVRVAGPGARVLEWSGTLTPYALEGVAADARRAGTGATVTVSVAATATDGQIAAIRARLAGVERLGVTVLVLRRPR